MTKALAISLLKNGLAGYVGDPYSLSSFFAQFDDACDVVALVPFLREVARVDLFYYDWDDNGSGGYPRGCGKSESFRSQALAAIQVIETNYAKLNPMAKLLQDVDPQIIELALDQIINDDCPDLALIPILADIVEEDVFLLPNIGAKGTKVVSQKIYLGEKAKKAIQSIKKIRGSQNDDQNASPESGQASRK
jgi:hypothetical protein